MIAVCEAARNIVCSGGEPFGVTNCLNFGNPTIRKYTGNLPRPSKVWEKLADKLNTPVTGGNVSFYNQGPEGPVFPTPTIGMVGLLENVEDKMTLAFEHNNEAEPDI